MVWSDARLFDKTSHGASPRSAPSMRVKSFAPGAWT